MSVATLEPQSPPHTVWIYSINSFAISSSFRQLSNSPSSMKVTRCRLGEVLSRSNPADGSAGGRAVRL